MASEHNSLGPAINRLNFPETSAEPLSLTRSELETLFTPLFDDSIGNRAPDVSTNSVVQPDNIPTPDTPSTSTSVVDDAPPVESPTTEEQTDSNNDDTTEALPE